MNAVIHGAGIGAGEVFPIKRKLALPPDMAPVLTVVIDTEEEFDWSAPFDPQATGVSNIDCQPLAQAVFDDHGVVPCYAIDYPVAATASSRDLLKAIADSGRCEIGAHLHPWVNPPHEGPVDARHSFPGNLPSALERAKLAALTEAIAEGFGARPAIYKAGRYGVGPATAGILADLGYRIDVSIVPYTDFSPVHGPDFTAFTTDPFQTTGGVTALPLSVGFAGALGGLGGGLYPALGSDLGRKLRLPGIAARLGLMERIRLTPEDHSLDDMMRLTRAALGRGQRLFMLTYHSSSLLPGATSYVRNDSDRRAFLDCLDGYFTFFRKTCAGQVCSVSSVAQKLTISR